MKVRLRFTVLFSVLALLIISFNGLAQSPFGKFSNLFTTPSNYVVSYTKVAPVIDGDINDAVWQQVAWTADFQDIEGNLKPKPALQTNVKMLWDDSCLYIAAQIHDPNVWAMLKKHDEIIFNDNDFEVFVNPNNTTHQYFEMEFNALNTIFDLFLNKPYRNGGNAMFSWDSPGLRSAVKIRGTLNDATDTDKGWIIEIALPYKAISLGNDVQVPRDGALWRINFSRVQWDTKIVDSKYIKLKGANGQNLPEHNWVWSPQGVVNMHYPERWGYLQFTKQVNSKFELPYSEQQKQYLWLVYYNQEIAYSKNKIYSKSLTDFAIDSKVMINNRSAILKLEATDHQFIALITDEATKITWTINQEGLVRQGSNFFLHD
jgi:hypothetical protein